MNKIWWHFVDSVSKINNLVYDLSYTLSVNSLVKKLLLYNIKFTEIVSLSV